MNIQITFRGIGPSDALESRIREKAEELLRFAPDLTSCHATVEPAHRHGHHGHLYSVHLVLRMPGKEIAVGRERPRNHAHEDVYVAIRDTFDAAVRRLEDYVRERRGQVKRHAVPSHGTVSRIYGREGYGFIQVEEGPEVYFHEAAVTDHAFSALRRGDEVRVLVAVGEGEKGPQASAVTPIGKHHLVSDLRAKSG